MGPPKGPLLTGEGVPRVDEQVEQHLFELDLMADDLAEPVRNVREIEADACEGVLLAYEAAGRAHARE